MTSQTGLWLAAVVATVASLVPTQSPAQGTPAGSQRSDIFEVAAIHVVLGASIGLVSASIAGDRATERVARGAAGGATMFAGKLSAANGFAAGGRILNALGAEVVASTSRSDWDPMCITTPVFVLRVAIRCRERPTIVVDVLTVVSALILTMEGVDLDIGATAKAGTLIFRSRTPNRSTAGWALGGSMVYRWDSDSRLVESRIGHEMVHVLQHDAAQWLVSRPLESALQRIAPKDIRAVLRHLDLGLYGALVWPLSDTPVDPRVLLESEARVLSGR